MIDTPDLYRWADDQAARDRVETGMARSSGKAERVSDGWNTRALEAVRLHAIGHETFMAEDVREKFPEPEQADGRAFGAVITQAKRKGWIVSDGFAYDRWGAPKTRWRSTIYDVRKEPKL